MRSRDIGMRVVLGNGAYPRYLTPRQGGSGLALLGGDSGRFRAARAAEVRQAPADRSHETVGMIEAEIVGAGLRIERERRDPYLLERVVEAARRGRFPAASRLLTVPHAASVGVCPEQDKEPGSI